MCPVISNVNAITNLHLNYMITQFFHIHLLGLFLHEKNNYLFKVYKQKSTWHKVSKECT